MMLAMFAGENRDDWDDLLPAVMMAPWPEGAPKIPVLGASTMAHTSQGSPSVAVLPPKEGVVLADVASVDLTGSLYRDLGLIVRTSRNWMVREWMFR